MRQFDTPDDLPTGVPGEVAFCAEPDDSEEGYGRLYLCVNGVDWVYLPGFADTAGTYEGLRAVWDQYRTAIDPRPEVTHL